MATTTPTLEGHTRGMRAGDDASLDGDEPDRAAKADGPAPPSEYNGTEVAALETQTDRTLIEGVIYEGRERVAGGTVRGWPRGDASVRTTHEPAFTVSVDPEGEFRIRDLKDGRHLLEVELAGKQKRLVYLELRPQRTHNRRIVVQLGTGVLRGRVYDRQGVPRAGKSVMVSGRCGGVSVAVETTIASDGTFEVAALAAGNYWIQSVPPNTPNHGVSAWMKQVVLTPGETEEVVLGRDPVLGLWEGRVFGSGGRVISQPGTIQLIRQADADETTESAEVLNVGYKDGRIRAPVPSGRYLVRVSPPGFQRKRLELEDALEMRKENLPCLPA